MVRVYGGMECRGSQKALRWLNSREIQFQYHDLRSTGLEPAELKNLITAFDWPMLIDKRIAAWRGLCAAQPTPLERQDIFTLLMQRPDLLKTPILNARGSWRLGWNAANKVHLLGQAAPATEREFAMDHAYVLSA